MTTKRKKALKIYGIIIIIALTAIMFVIPDSAFLKLYNKNIKKINNQEVKENNFVDYDTQIEHLLNKQFKYEYLLLDSLSDKSYTYNCSGKIDKDIESGTCTEPERISYTETTKKDLFKINTNYLDISYIFDYLKDYKPEETKYRSSREFKYNTKLEDLDTEIIVYTDLDEITKVEISNKFMTYVLKYSDISY